MGRPQKQNPASGRLEPAAGGVVMKSNECGIKPASLRERPMFRLPKRPIRTTGESVHRATAESAEAGANANTTHPLRARRKPVPRKFFPGPRRHSQMRRSRTFVERDFPSAILRLMFGGACGSFRGPAELC